MQVSLDNKLGALAQISQKKLLDILTKIPGRKDLIIDSTLIKPLERIVGVSKLRLVPDTKYNINIDRGKTENSSIFKKRFY